MELRIFLSNLFSQLHFVLIVYIPALWSHFWDDGARVSAQHLILVNN